jgi:hypothetical protein
MEISISFTTHSDKTKFAEASLLCISQWKNQNHQLIVTCHDASKDMISLLNYYKNKKTIDDLFFTSSNFGHLRGVNFCLEKAKGKYFFNINHDVLVKNKCVVDDCRSLLQEEKNGMVGWFWIGNGCYWVGDKLNFTLRNNKIEKNDLYNDPIDLINAIKINKIKNVIPNESWAWCCNTSFFGIRTNLFKSLGGFSTKDFKHEYADDYLTYQLLERKLNVLDLPKHIYNYNYFDSMTRCKWHDLGLRLEKKESKKSFYLNKFI